jgi:hypothetical protein
VTSLFSLAHLLLINSWIIFSLACMGSLSFYLTRKYSLDVRLIISLFFGAYLVLTIGYVASIFGIGLWHFFQILTLLNFLLLVNYIRSEYHQFKFKNQIRKKGRKQKNATMAFFIKQKIKRSEVRFFVFSWLVSLVPVLLPFIYFTRNESFLVTFTRGNNDTGPYVLEAEAMLRSGFENSGFLQNQDFFKFAAENDFGAPALLAWVSAVANIQPWEGFTPTLSLVSFLIVFTSGTLVRIVFQRSTTNTFLVGLITLSNAPILYLFSNVFLSQLLAMAVVLAISLVMYIFILDREERLFNKSIVFGSFLTVLTFTYVHMSLVIIASSLFGFVLVRLLIKSYRTNPPNRASLDLSRFNAFFLFILLSLGFTLLSTSPFLRHAIRRAKDISSQNAGWPLPQDPSFGSFLIVGDFNFPGGNIFGVISWAIVLLMMTVFGISVLRDRESQDIHYVFFLVTSIFMPLFISFVAGLILGFSNYKAWKLLFFYSVILLAFVLFAKFKEGKLLDLLQPGITLLISGLFLAANLTTWSPVIYSSENHRILSSSRDLYNLEDDLKLIELESLNIDLTPYFEVMLAAAVVPSSQVFINSPAYFPALADTETCTLIRLDERERFPSEVKVTELNRTYALIDFPADCKIVR